MAGEGQGAEAGAAAAEVEAALRRWGAADVAGDYAAMCRRWPELLECSLEEDLRPRLAQLDFLVREGVLSPAASARLVVEQPRTLGGYAITVLWEQDGLIAINKPFDMRIDLPKGEAHRWPEERTVSDWFCAIHPDARVRFCNQLDHATSGILLLASTKAAGRIGSQLFEKHRAKKTYLALVLGHPAWTEEVRLTDRLADGEGFARRIARADEPGETAETLVRVLRRGVWPASFAEDEGASIQTVQASLVEVRLITGRRHQIRLHLSEAGHPILGDANYGGEPGGDQAGAYRMFLHSHRLELPLPSGERVEVQAPCSFAQELAAPPGDARADSSLAPTSGASSRLEASTA